MDESFGQWVKQRRAMRDITQRALADQAGCTVYTIRKLEANRLRPSQALAERLAAALSISPAAHAAFCQFARGRAASTPDVLRPDMLPLPKRFRSAHTLPLPSTPLLGRTADAAAVQACLLRDDVRLLTLIGSPGVGKTRLALHVAANVAPMFRDGVCVVDLASLRDATLVLPTVARALEIPETSGASLLATLQQVLANQHLLLVLDNAEQVCAAAPALAELLAYAPRLATLVTSRVPLHLLGEHTFAVAPLALPPDHQQLSADALVAYPAVELFVQRARAIQYAFALDATNARAVADICARLDGVPLAIELAAARLTVLPPQALLRRLDQRLDVLTGTPADAAPHHRTLRDAISWSYDLLDTDAQALFRRLGLFAGGWTLEAAEAVCAEPGAWVERHADHAAPRPPATPPILDHMALLGDHRLGAPAPGADDEPRFTMLETLRAFALDRCHALGEAEVAQARHAAYYLEFAEDAAPCLHGPEQQRWLQRLDADLDNLRAALAWSQTTSRDSTFGARFVVALAPFWETRGYLTEAWSWMRQVEAHSASVAPAFQALVKARAAEFALARGEHAAASTLAEECLALQGVYPPAQVHAIALGVLGMVAQTQNAYGDARARYEESLHMSRALGDGRQVALMLHRLGTLAEIQGDCPGAMACFEAALELSRQAGDIFGIVRPLIYLGYTACYSGDHGRAIVLFEESLMFARQVEDQQGMGSALNGLGEAARLKGDYAQAATWFQESRTIFQRIGKRASLAPVLQNLGRVALRRGDIPAALRSFAESRDIWRQLNDTLGIALCLAGYAGVANAQRQPVCAARLLGATAAALDRIGVMFDGADRADYDGYVAAARTQLDAATFDAAWAAGCVLPLDQALAEAAEVGYRPEEAPSPRNKPIHPAGLTEREVDVLRLVTQGLTNAQIAAQLVISPLTVTTHLHRIYGKLDVTSRSGATRFAVEHGLV